jgi:hypothetical protein
MPPDRAVVIHSISVVFFTTFGLFDFSGALARGIDARRHLTHLPTWVYWISVLSSIFPRQLGRPWVSVLLSLNIYITSAYWTLRAESSNGGLVECSPRDFVIHGGLLGFFMRAVRIGLMKPPGSPIYSASIVAILLLFNFMVRRCCFETQRDGGDVHLTECTVLKAIVAPTTGALVAASCGGWCVW